MGQRKFSRRYLTAAAVCVLSGVVAIAMIVTHHHWYKPALVPLVICAVSAMAIHLFADECVDEEG